jgi:PAS domain S-box-containing protein
MSIDNQSLILVVDDDPGIGILQRRRLERAGFRVEVATTIDGALSTLHRGGVALVVLDYRLGETTGLDLHRRMKASGVDTPVILVSAAMEDAVVVEALRAGVRDIVVKGPDYLDHLPDAVRGVLDQTSEVAPPAAAAQATCVLIVEDDPATASLERRQLERAGYSVKVATTPEEARTAVAAGDVALAVLDLRLAGGASGLELYEEWKAAGSAVPAILVTAFADQAVAIRALRSGIRDFVPKSSDFLEYLPGAVDRVVGQVRIERKLADSELRLASIIGTTLDAILMCDAAARVVLFNRAAEQLFGLPAAEAIGRPVTSFVPDLILEGAAEAGRVRQRRELDAVTVDGRQFPIEVSVSEVAIHGQRLLTVIARDISERRRAEEDLREADRRKDEFLGMLAHELRNPLAAIMNAGDLLNRTIGDGGPHKLIGVVQRQTRVLARMVDDLLDVSRVTLGKIQLAREPMILAEPVTRAVDAMREAATRAGLEVKLEIDAEPIWIDGDTTRLEQVVTNLLANAVKFTPGGGSISVTVTGEDGLGVVRVRDPGIGIPKALLPRVFDLFTQGETSLDRSRSGLGIGLALVRKIVQMHGGEVTASSAGPGRGSEFTVRLPAQADYARPHEERPDRQPAARRMRVLVVDDQRDVADSLAMLVETLGHTARAVYGGADALAASRTEPVDAMLIDIGMPGMTGYEVAERIRRDPELASLHLIALTGYGRDEDRALVAKAGFDRHIIKPVTDTELEAVLAAAAISSR